MLRAARLRLPALPSPAAPLRTRTLSQQHQQQPSPSSAHDSPPPPSSPADPSSSSSSERDPPPPPPQTWLTKAIRQSPAAKRVFLSIAGLLGYGSPKQYAGRRAFNMYSDICISRPDDEAAFWKQECHLPPTFQSWFTVTNLHVWLLTVRLRALPPPQGQHFVQALIDHFFLDVEDRVRAVLQPVGDKSLAPSQNLAPYTRRTDFYAIANSKSRSSPPRGRAPESLVTRQMKIFKEQWAGMGMSFDLGLVRSDAELAAAVWRNLLGARGARGIAYAADDPSRPYFRRTVNLFGSQVEKFSKLNARPGGIEAEERRDDGSGVHDFPPAEVDKYVAYPETMAVLVEYVRRELVRLQAIPDDVILGKGVIGTENHGLEVLRFGPVKRPDSLAASFAQEQEQ